MKFRMTCLVALAAISFSACEGMSGEYSETEYETHTASSNSPIPPPPVMPAPPAGTGGPSQMSRPSAAPPPMTTGGPSQMPKPPTATPPPAPASGCTPPNVFIRTEANGALEIKCAAPPMAPPASLKCTAPEALTWLTRNGMSSYVCMK